MEKSKIIIGKKSYPLFFAQILQFLNLAFGIVFILFGLILLLVSFIAGCIFILIGVFFIYLSRRYSKAIKNFKSLTHNSEQSSEVLSNNNEKFIKVEAFEKSSKENNGPIVNVVGDSIQVTISAKDTKMVVNECGEASCDTFSETDELLKYQNSAEFVDVESSKQETISENIVVEPSKKDEIPENTVAEQAKSKEEIDLSEILFPRITDQKFLLAYTYQNVSIAFPSLDNLKLYNAIYFEREPSNQHDSNAIAVLHNGNKIGYVYRGKLQKMISDFMYREHPIVAYVDSISDSKFTIALGFYKPLESFKHTSTTLTKTSKKDIFGNSRQDNLVCISEGDLLEIEYNYETETYVVTDDCGNELGELPKSVSSKLLESENEYSVVCQNIEIDDSLKTKCKVIIITN